jgi:hypothetical protein
MKTTLILAATCATLAAAPLAAQTQPRMSAESVTTQSAPAFLTGGTLGLLTIIVVGGLLLSAGNPAFD